jgi:hypothetical protein
MSSLWIDEQEEIGEIEPYIDSGTYKDAKSYSEPELQDYFTELKISNLGRKKERYIRRRAWWKGNDKRRDANIKQNLSDEERENLQALDKMLDPSDDNDRIMNAEIKRELGEFKDAKAILQEPFVDDLSQAISILKELIQRGEPFVAEMKFEN